MYIYSTSIMATWEDVFATWAKGPGETEQTKCENAESVIKRAIKNSSALSRLDQRTFTQGSYAARTSVSLDSDVDICVCLNQNFYYQLPSTGSQNPADYGIGPATISFGDFKNLVGRALESELGSSAIKRGNKAFDVHENNYRVDADVAPAFEHRRYTGFDAYGRPTYISGIEIVSDAGEYIINWPQQTLDNGVAKNDRTNRRYKRIIRILKRLRNAMQDEKINAANDIASFLIECLVWNVPDSYFVADSYTPIVHDVLAHTFNATRTQDECNDWGEVNELMYLFRDGLKAWTREQAHDFIASAWDYLGFE